MIHVYTHIIPAGGGGGVGAPPAAVLCSYSEQSLYIYPMYYIMIYIYIYPAGGGGGVCAPPAAGGGVAPHGPRRGGPAPSLRPPLASLRRRPIPYTYDVRDI